jgi:large subunit ribosomal protein L4
MKLNVKIGGKSDKSVDVSDVVFDAGYNEPMIHQVVTAQMAGERAGTKAQKNRRDSRGGGAKPWKQKGTGRARAGTNRSPIWVGGARAFAARPRDFSQKVNKKMFRGAMRAMLSELLRKERLVVVNEFTLETPKTKGLLLALKQLDVADALLVLDCVDDNLLMASNNLPHIAIVDAQGLDPLALIGFKKVVMTEAALRQLEERLL